MSSSEANGSAVDLKKVLHQIVNLPQRFFSEFFELAAYYNLRHEPRFSLIGDESMVSIKMYLPGSLVMEFRLGLSYPKTPPLFFVHSPLKNFSRQLHLEWNLQVEQKIDRLNYAMKRVIQFNEANKKAHFYFAYGREGVTETMDADVAAKHNLILMLTNMPLDGAYVSISDAHEDEVDLHIDEDDTTLPSDSGSVLGSQSFYSEQSSINDEPTYSFNETETESESIRADVANDEDSEITAPRAGRREFKKRRPKPSRISSGESEEFSQFDGSENSFVQLSLTAPSTGRRSSMNKGTSASNSERGIKRKSAPKLKSDRSNRLSMNNKELGYYLADRQGKNFQVVPKSMNKQNVPHQMLKFKCILDKITLSSKNINQKQYLVFCICQGNNVKMILKTRPIKTKGNPHTFNISKNWKVKTQNPEKLHLLIQLKSTMTKQAVDVIQEIGYVKMNFVALATGPVTNKLEIISSKDFSVVEGIVTFDLDIREYFKKTILKLDLSVDPAPKVKFDAGLYCQVWHVENYKESESQAISSDNLVATSKPFMKLHSNSWSLKINFPKAHLKKLVGGALIVKLLTKQINLSELEGLMSKNDSTLSLSYASTVIKLEDILPVGYYDGVEFRATLKTPDEKSIVGDLFGVATWRNLPLRAQMEGGQYESKKGIISGDPVMGALPPQQKGPLHVKTSLLAGTFEQMMAAQKEEYPDLGIPFILYFLGEIVENKGGMRTEGIFNHTFPANTLRETIWELQKSNFSTVLHPREAASLIKAWLRTVDEPIIPQKEYDTCLRKCNANPDTLAQMIESFPPENQNILAFLIRLLRKVEQHRVHTKMDFHTLAVVMAPCICRCPGNNEAFLQSTVKETEFVENILRNLGTERKKEAKRKIK